MSKGKGKDWETVAFGGPTTFEKWLDKEGIDVVTGDSLDDVRSVPLKPWPRKGGLGVHICLKGAEGCNSAYVCEIPSKESLKPQRHLFEEMVFVLSGEGKTEVWNEGGRKVECKWQSGSLFAVPLNAWHQHFNTGDKPARYFAVTSAPPVIDLFHNDEFVFENPFVFRDRFNGKQDYFSGKGTLYGERIWDINLVPNVETIDLVEWKARGGRSSEFELANNTMIAHASEYPVGTYKKAHRHNPGAHVLQLSGEGYSLMWKEGQPKERFDWHRGTVIVPPRDVFHQHFNTGSEPARYLALRWGSNKFRTGKHLSGGEGWYYSISEGGNQIEYEEEDREIRKMFEEELQRKGIELRMPAR